MKKPAVGLLSRTAHAEVIRFNRVTELLDAIKANHEAGLLIPSNWVDELKELTA